MYQIKAITPRKHEEKYKVKTSCPFGFAEDRLRGLL
jgi:hypothetical protein